MSNKSKKYAFRSVFTKVDKKEEFTPTYEVVLIERNGLGEPYENKNREECKLCGEVHPVRVKHYLATSGDGLASQFEYHRKKNPMPKRKKNTDTSTPKKENKSR